MSAAGAFATFGRRAGFAAVFPEVVGQGAKGGVVGSIDVERALSPRDEQAGVDQALQVMTQGGSGHVHVGLNGPGGRPLGALLDDEPKHTQADRVTQRRELLGVLFECSLHISNSNFIEVECKGSGSIFRRRRFLASSGGSLRLLGATLGRT